MGENFVACASIHDILNESAPVASLPFQDIMLVRVLPRLSRSCLPALQSLPLLPSASASLSTSMPCRASYAPEKLHDIPQPPTIDFPKVRYKNPAFIPDPDPDNIETHT